MNLVSRLSFAFLLPVILLTNIISPVCALAAEIPAVPGFYVVGAQAGAWPDILHSLGLREQAAESARILVLPEGSAAELRDITTSRPDRILILEGDSKIARAFGIFPTSRHASVRKVKDVHQPGLSIVWEKAIEVPVYKMPQQAKILLRDRVHGAPLMAIWPEGSDHVLWMATPPGEKGYERYPFLLHALLETGLQPMFESRRLWAFFDPGIQQYRDSNELAHEWRQMGLAAIHVSAWYFFETNSEEDARLRKLIAACHREGILVYAWLELPHVSAAFWNRHPRWREKTALGKDAKIDWRLLMNLANPDCRRAVVAGVRGTLARFDWDGVNFAELYFDGVTGISNPENFTPLNADVRHEVKAAYGFDPMELFSGARRDPKKLRQFLEYRVDLAARLQEFWIEELEKMRAEKPHLDLVLTYVDDRFDTTMRDAIGADAARSIKGIEHHDLTFIIEDPYTLWGLGPKRYAEIANRYRSLTSRQERLGVDINIVERGNAYPTAQQTGVELAQLIHTAVASFPTVMYYYTGSIGPLDAPLLPVASAVVTQAEHKDDGLTVESPYGVGVRWAGLATLDGKTWPVQDGECVWVPAGKHILRSTTPDGLPLVTDFTGNLETATMKPDGVEISYNSQSRAFAKLSRNPLRLLVDGREDALVVSGRYILQLPRGRHLVRIFW